MKLDDEQLQVVSHMHGPAVVIAGAGSGKTTVMTHLTTKILELPNEYRVLSMTFSRKAAEEMRQRAKKVLGEEKAGLLERATMGTYHSFGYSLIREFWEKMGYKNRPTLMEDREAENLIKPLIREKKEEAETQQRGEELSWWSAMKPSLILEAYGNFKDEGYRLQNMDGLEALYRALLKTGKMDKMRFNEALMTSVWGMLKKYESHKQQYCLLDYEDLIIGPVDFLKADKTSADLVVARFDRIMVDEAQDTSKAQYEMIKLLAPHGNIVMVGDDDQAIYEWRGAKKENLESFMKDFGATMYRLQTNYRSQGHIVNAAAELIANNKNRFGNRPKPHRNSVDLPLLMLHDRGDEAADRSALMAVALAKKGFAWDDQCVIYRTNAMAKALQMAFLKYQIPVQLLGDVDLRKRTEVRLLVAAVRLFLENPNDTQAFHTIAEFVPGLGAGAIAKMEKEMLEKNLPILDATSCLKGKALEAVQNLRNKGKALQECGLGGAVNWILHSDGLNARDWWLQKDPESVHGRLHTLSILDVSIQRWVNTSADPLEDFFATFLDASFQDEHEEGKVTLSTIHRVKGLEWKVVQMYGFSEGFMPFGISKANLDKGDAGAVNVEEERRLTYVGMTRAKDILLMHHANQYLMFGEVRDNVEVSPFFHEIRTIAHKDGRRNKKAL